MGTYHPRPSEPAVGATFEIIKTVTAYVDPDGHLLEILTRPYGSGG
jgi:hypothetical protein